MAILKITDTTKLRDWTTTINDIIDALGQVVVLSPDDITTIKNDMNKIISKDIAINGDITDLASARGLFDAHGTGAIDFNTLTKQGIYAVPQEGSTNGPGFSCRCLVFSASGSYIVNQIAIGERRLAFRYKNDVNNTSWTQWKQIVSEYNIGDGIAINNGVVSVPEYEGATSSSTATSGLVPPAISSEKDNFLKGDGTWGDIGESSIIATGSDTPRNLADRFSDIVNVKDFGAVGDGIEDDTAAIQAALEYARTMPTLKPVVGTGTYRITGQLRIRRSYMPIHINEIVVSDWSLAEDEPAIWVTAQGCDIYISKLDCGRLCSGIKLDNSDNVLRDGFYIWHYRGYGLTWTQGNNYIGAGLILFNGSQDEDWDDYETPRPPCVLVDGIDSKIVGLSAGRGAPVVKITENASLNIFHNCHFWRGNSVTDNKPVDPVLIENYSEATNQFIGCYFDNGKIDLYAYGLSIIGGAFLNLTSAVSLSHPYIRYFCNEKAASTSTIQGIKFGIITGIKGISVGFFDYNGHTWAIDLSKVTTMVADGQLPPGAESNVKDSQVIIHVGYDQPYEKVYVGQNFADQNIVLGGGPRIVTRTYENYRRVWKPEETQGFYLFLGSGGQFTGIGESLQSPGTLHLCCGSQNDDGTYNKMSINPAGLFPKYDNKMSLGHPSTRYTQVYVAASAIATSDEREKQNIETYPDNVLDAWGEVELRQFLFNDAVEKKGEAARIHSGVIAQQVVAVFEKHGLDATRYGLLCYDEWGDEYETVEVEDAPAVLDSEGNEVAPAKTHMEKRLVTAAGDRYGIRYSEALCIEAAYQRRRADRLETRMLELEKKLSELESKIS